MIMEYAAAANNTTSVTMSKIDPNYRITAIIFYDSGYIPPAGNLKVI